MKKVVAGVLLGSLLLLSGCSSLSPSEEIAKTTTAFTQEEIKANRTGVIGANQENIVYQYVSNSVQVNKDKLIAVDADDAKIIKDKVVEINEALRTGKNIIKAKKTETSKIENSTSEASNKENSTSEASDTQTSTKTAIEESSSNNEVSETEADRDKVIISDSIANYMLHYFAKTPYTWEMEDCKIVGMDSATHLYFVDVYYKTTNEKKNVLPDSILTLGMPNYSALVKQRYEDYISIMTAKDRQETEKYNNLKTKFIKTWGTIDEIAENLDFDSPLKYAAKYGSKYKGIGSYAYAGTKNTYNITGAKVVYRMVMGYNYSIQDKVIIEPKAVYVYQSSINNAEDLINSLKSDHIDASEIIGPIINRKLYSYEKAMDEADHNGLFSLYKSYKKYDRETYMYDKYAYHKLGSYVYDVLGRKDNKIYVEVTFNNKERTKGSAMSEANYKDVRLFTFMISEDDNLKLIDVLDLERDIVGEPLSVISKVNGVQDQINYSEAAFTPSNQKAVENTLKEFMKLELTQQFGSEVFKTCIDLGINANELDNIKKTLASISANQVTTWITGYSTKSNLYVNAQLREIYVNTEKHTAYETTANIGLINRNGKWFVVSYNRTMNVRLQSLNYSDIDSIEHYMIKDNKIVSIKKEVATVESNSEG